MCTFTWFLKDEGHMKTFPQCWHLWGFFPVCILMRFCKDDDQPKAFPHCVHSYGFSPVCVGSHVTLEGSGRSESFPTFFTFIHFLFSVNSQMFSKCWGPPEGFSTLLTFTRFLSSVSFHVILNGLGRIESFPTGHRYRVSFQWLSSHMLESFQAN